MSVRGSVIEETSDFLGQQEKLKRVEGRWVEIEMLVKTLRCLVLCVDHDRANADDVRCRKHPAQCVDK